MTCQDYESLLNERDREHTRAERSAQHNHFKECTPCRVMTIVRARMVLECFQPEEQAAIIALVYADCVEELVRENGDPEACRRRGGYND